MKTLRENAYGEVEGGHCFTYLCTGRVPGVSANFVLMQLAVCGCVSLAFQWLVFYLQPRPAVQEYGGGEHHLYGGGAQVSGWYWEPEVMDFFPPGWL